jgi:hypothetical protein
VKAPDWLLANKVSLPFRRKGRARVECYTLTHKRCEEVNWMIVLHCEDRAFAYPGKYTGLRVDGITVTSDEAHEIADQLPFIERATGRVLLTGLGIGMCLQALLRKPEIDHVTVVEECADVLYLVEPHYRAIFGLDRFTCVHADAFCWYPPIGTRFDYAYHDIWPVATGWFWPQHKQLFAHYDGYVTEQDSWRGDWMKARFEKNVSV